MRCSRANPIIPTTHAAMPRMPTRGAQATGMPPPPNGPMTESAAVRGANEMMIDHTRPQNRRRTTQPSSAEMAKLRSHATCAHRSPDVREHATSRRTRGGRAAAGAAERSACGTACRRARPRTSRVRTTRDQSHQQDEADARGEEEAEAGAEKPAEHAEDGTAEDADACQVQDREEDAQRRLHRRCGSRVAV